MPGGESQPEVDHQTLPLFNEQVEHLDHLVRLKSVNLIKMLNLFNSIKVFNLFTFLGQSGSPRLPSAGDWITPPCAGGDLVIGYSKSRQYARSITITPYPHCRSTPSGPGPLFHCL